MKRLLAGIAILGLLTGCATAHQERAATKGAAVGAVAGTIIGGANDKPLKGAVIGGVIGGLAGAILADDDRVVASERRYHRRSCRRGDAYFDRAARTRNLERKIRLMREGLRLCPGNPAAHNDLGVALMLNGEFGKARRQFYIALDLEPGYVPAKRNLARLNRIEKRRHHGHHYGKHDHDRHDGARIWRDDDSEDEYRRYEDD